jgi:hypothetical protein
MGRRQSAVVSWKIDPGLHPVAFENSFAGSAQAGAPHLKALLHGVVITEILATKTRRIARTRGLFLPGACMLGQRTCTSRERNSQTRDNGKNSTHH